MADATSEAVEVVAVTWRRWNLKRWGQRRRQKGWSLVRRRQSLEWEEIERSDDKEAGTGNSGQSWPKGSKFGPGAGLRDFEGLGQALLFHTPTRRRININYCSHNQSYKHNYTYYNI